MKKAQNDRKIIKMNKIPTDKKNNKQEGQKAPLPNQEVRRRRGIYAVVTAGEALFM